MFPPYCVFVKPSLTAPITRGVVKWMYHAEQKLFTTQNSISAKLQREKILTFQNDIYTFFFNFVKPFQKDVSIALFFRYTHKKIIIIAAQKKREWVFPSNFYFIFFIINEFKVRLCYVTHCSCHFWHFFLYCIHGLDHCVLNYFSITILEDNC